MELPITVYSFKVRPLLEDALVVDVLAKVQLIIIDVLLKAENTQRLRALSSPQVNVSMKDPEMTNFHSWAGLNAPRLLPIEAPSGSQTIIVENTYEQVGYYIRYEEGEKILDIEPIHVFLAILSLIFIYLLLFVSLLVITMKILSWNARGVGRKSFSSKLFRLIQNY